MSPLSEPVNGYKSEMEVKGELRDGNGWKQAQQETFAQYELT